MDLLFIFPGKIGAVNETVDQLATNGEQCMHFTLNLDLPGLLEMSKTEQITVITSAMLIKKVCFDILFVEKKKFV